MGQAITNKINSGILRVAVTIYVSTRLQITNTSTFISLTVQSSSSLIIYRYGGFIHGVVSRGMTSIP